MESKQNHNIAFYLKYRPQSLDELIGQETTKKIIVSAFKNNKLSHAYLLVGPRGTGKTSTARILAKMVNCEGEKVPCNKCHTCLSITDGSNLDLIEIDAASNRGIEDIRTLREKIKLSPSAARKKVYIIDEAHMLTAEAFNALLKTLEEPPSHVLFILATTDVKKLPPTILSRVQRLDFKLAQARELSQALQKIATLEKIDIDEVAVNLLVKKADGSFRDGIKFLDQLSSLGGKITSDVLQKSLMSIDAEAVLKLTKSFIEKDATAALALVLKQVEAGVDTNQLILSLMETLRNLLFIKNGLGELVKDKTMAQDYQELVTAADAISSRQLIKILDILQQALEKLKFASIPSLPLELAVVEICGSEHSENSVSQIRSADQPSPADSSDILKIREKWTFVLETIKPFNFSLEALLRSINILKCTDTTIIMEVPYSFHQRILEAPKNRDLLESILSDILGRSIQLSTVLGNRPQKMEDVANIEVAADDEIIRAAAEIFNSDSIN